MNDRLDRMKKKYGDTVSDEKEVPVCQENKPADKQTEDPCEFKPGATGWRGCASISLLRAYLDDHAELKARVGMSDGVLAMRFEPPINAYDSNRLRHAVEAVELLRDAKDDILMFFEAGAIRLVKFKRSWEA